MLGSQRLSAKSTSIAVQVGLEGSVRSCDLWPGWQPLTCWSCRDSPSWAPAIARPGTCWRWWWTCYRLCWSHPSARTPCGPWWATQAATFCRSGAPGRRCRYSGGAELLRPLPRPAPPRSSGQILTRHSTMTSTSLEQQECQPSMTWLSYVSTAYTDGVVSKLEDDGLVQAEAGTGEQQQQGQAGLHGGTQHHTPPGHKSVSEKKLNVFVFLVGNAGKPPIKCVPSSCQSPSDGYCFT